MAFFKIAAIVLLVLSAYFYINSIIKKKLCTASVNGTIVFVEERVERDAGRAKRSYFVPLYQYEVDGKTYTAYGSKFGKTFEQFKVGESDEIKYNPANPEVCVVNGKTGREEVAFIIAIFGIVFGVIAIFRG